MLLHISFPTTAMVQKPTISSFYPCLLVLLFTGLCLGSDLLCFALFFLCVFIFLSVLLSYFSVLFVFSSASVSRVTYVYHVTAAESSGDYLM